MNILTDAMPQTVTIATTEYQVDTDHRAALRSILAFEDNELTPQEKQIILLTNLYPTVPDDIDAALVTALWFLNGGKDSEEHDGPRLFSFSKDAQLIFAAFRQTHGIDLSSANLHWWAFLALFMDLGQDTAFCQLIAFRKRIREGKASKEEKEIARAMGDVFDVPEVDNRTLEEKEAEARFLRLVELGQQKRNTQYG